MSTKVAVYARVSTLLGQDPRHQTIPIQEHCLSRGFVIHNEYIDFISGSKERKPMLDTLIKDAMAGKFEIVVIYALDRLGRDTRGLLNLIHTLDANGVCIISLRESLDFTTPVGRACLAIFSAVSTLEGDLIRERIKTALAAKKAIAKVTNNGWVCGRPKILNDELVSEILRLRSTGLSIRAIERHLGKIVSHTVIGRVVRGVNKPS